LDNQGWMIHEPKTDYVKFAKAFNEIIFSLYWQDPRNKADAFPWSCFPNKKPATLAEQFVWQSGQYENSKAQKEVVDLMLKKFDNRYEDFGLLIVQKERNFDQNLILSRWLEKGKKCEILNVEVAIEDIHGDHAIPWIKGVFAGGTNDYENLRVIHKKLNQNKKDRYFNEYVESGDWKNISV
jgi:hypothetical protein